MIISQNNIEKIYNHVKESYPYECCGILLGKTREVKEVRLVENVNQDRAHDRYELSPTELYEIDKYARATGLNIIGFYHSHPDHPAYPSAFDTEMAVEGYVYLIVAVDQQGRLKARAWTLEGCDHFLELRLTVVKKNGRRQTD